MSGAVISGSGVITFDDGSASTWNCGFDSGSSIMDLRISGVGAVLKLDDFVASGTSATSYQNFKNGYDSGKIKTSFIKKAGTTMLFENFSMMIFDQVKIEASVRASEQTQMLLDAVWQSGLENEQLKLKNNV